MTRLIYWDKNFSNEYSPETVMSIGLDGHLTWFWQSCDSTTLDYLIWGNVINQVWKNNSQSNYKLKEDIIHFFIEIEPELCQIVIDNFNVCTAASRGSLANNNFQYKCNNWWFNEKFSRIIKIMCYFYSWQKPCNMNWKVFFTKFSLVGKI